MDHPAAPQLVSAVVVYSAEAGSVAELAVTLAAGATVEDALRASGLLSMFASIDIAVADVGVWGRKAALAQPLREADRVEIYRPLLVDPKVARRERFARQGARTTGLFAKKRAGAKAGY